ncbi:hypothetical protein JKP88DRAFT_288425 [Tribonema minus]|uniref:Secreted protein n=1 Tax=Tribonema minus TaxID=303371 RepID=A0A835Z3M0_9STRA|nr:hypothetical protein JKP88DRAFT_288425 [Tribonema minus]
MRPVPTMAATVLLAAALRLLLLVGRAADPPHRDNNSELTGHNMNLKLTAPQALHEDLSAAGATAFRAPGTARADGSRLLNAQPSSRLLNAQPTSRRAPDDKAPDDKAPDDKASNDEAPNDKAPDN